MVRACENLELSYNCLLYTSGYEYEIREQNGADEDILSNLSDMKTLMNLTKDVYKRQELTVTNRVRA